MLADDLFETRQQLLEAVDPEVFRVANAVRKDPSLAPIFKRPSETVDAEQLYAAFIRHIVPHHAVRRFMRSRQTMGFQWLGHDFRRVLSLINTSPSQREFMADNLADMFKELVKAANQAKAGKFSTQTRNELRDWINGNARWHRLSNYALSELDATEGIRPTTPTVLYRGLLFNKWQIEGSDSDPRNAKVFLKAAREGDRATTHIWEHPSSWSKSKNVAERFAKYGPASSKSDAMMQWFTRGRSFIDGELGVVISTLARPEDVVVDMGLITVNGQHGDEGEMILRPGERLVKVVAMFDKHGPIDLDERRNQKSKATHSEQVLQDVHKAVEKLDGAFSNPFDGMQPITALMPHVIEIAMANAMPLGQRLDELLAALRPVLSQVASTSLDHAELHPDNPEDGKRMHALKEAYMTMASIRHGLKDHHKPFAGANAADMLSDIAVPFAQEMLRQSKANGLLHRMMLAAKEGKVEPFRRERPLPFHTMTAAKSAEHLREVFEDAIRATGSEPPPDWTKVVERTRQIITDVMRLMEVAKLVGKLCELVRVFHGSEVS